MSVPRENRPPVARRNARWAALAATVFVACGVGCHRDGRDTPWQARYFESETPAGQPYFTKNHKAIDFNWGTGAPLESWIEDNFSIHWETCLRVDRLARITFRLASDDGSRLYINGDRIIDNWGEHGFDQTGSRTIVLSPGTHRVGVDYFEAGGLARVRLTAKAQPPDVIEWLPPPAAANGMDAGSRRCGGGGS